MLFPSLRAIQFAAVLGDLQHKFDTYIYYQSYNSTVSCLFANHEQAWFLRTYEPALVPPEYNDHSLGTVFEFLYYGNLTFRLDYLSALPLPCH